MSFALLKPTRHDVYPFIDPKSQLKNAATGKTVLVTGSGTGIGRAIAQSFAQAGATHVILVARRTEKLEATKMLIVHESPDCKVTVVGGIDVSEQQSVDKIFESLVSSADIPDVLVANAAISTLAKIADSDPTSWWRAFEVNTFGSYLLARAYIRAVRATSKKGGLIINVSSNASWGGLPGMSSYTGSKMALNKLTEYIDLEERSAPDGISIRCVALHPGGVVETEMASSALDPDSPLPEHVRRMMIDKPALPGGTAVYLSTPRAKFLMGRFVSATWDLEELEKLRERVADEDLLKGRVLGVT